MLGQVVFSVINGLLASAVASVNSTTDLPIYASTSGYLTTGAASDPCSILDVMCGSAMIAMKVAPYPGEKPRPENCYFTVGAARDGDQIPIHF